MIIKIIVFLILGISLAGACFAQSRDPGTVGESSSTGVWPSVDSGSSGRYGASDHGNVS